MKTGQKNKGSVKVCDGNRAAAYGVLLSRPNVVAIYPITPQTSLIEYLAQFKADGLLNSEVVEVEGEISSMGVAIGAALAGGRSFTASSSMGLYFMFDTYAMAPLARVPLVMVNANRENSPAAVAAGQQDILSVAETGWIQIHTEGDARKSWTRSLWPTGWRRIRRFFCPSRWPMTGSIFPTSPCR